jgi:hypothetical protein
VPTKPKKEKAPPGPDDLVRTVAGEYTSGDRRFTVRSSDANWYVVDNEQANEFGQELIHGPFATLAKARTAIAGARDVKPLLRSVARPKRSTKSKADQPPSPPPKPKPRTWLDKLPSAEAAEARRLIRALEKEGVAKAEDVVERDRGSFVPAAARALLGVRVAQLIEDGSDKSADELARDVVKLLTEEGVRARHPLPGWELVETDKGGRDKPRRITLS